MGNYKDELGHEYGDFIVTNYTDLREPSNGCVMWECTCKHCDVVVYRNGNNLRFSKYMSCPNCRKMKRK